MQGILQNYLISPRTWATIAAIAVSVFGENQLGLTPDQITKIVMAIGALVVGTSLRTPRSGTDVPAA